MAYERGSGGAGGKSGNESFKKTLAEYTAHYNNKNGFQNKQLDDPYFNSSKPAGSTMRKTPSKSNPNRKPPPNDPYFDSRKPAGNYMGQQGPRRGQPSAPRGLVPPLTAPATPNTSRNSLESNSTLSSAAKSSPMFTRTEWDNTTPYAGYYDHKLRGITGVADQVAFDPATMQHEAIHAWQGDWYQRSRSAGDIIADTNLLARQGYDKVGEIFDKDTLDFYRNYYGENFDARMPEEYQAFMGEGWKFKPGELPPWYVDKHLSGVWSPQAIAQQPPPRPVSPPIQAPKPAVRKYPVRWR